MEIKEKPKLRICGGGAGDKMFYNLRVEVPDSVSIPSTITGVLSFQS